MNGIDAVAIATGNDWRAMEARMGLMDRMMERMIKQMSVEEKEEMMLKMMPLMMKEVDFTKLMPQMASEMGKLVNFSGLFTFLRKASQDKEIKDNMMEIKEQLPNMTRKMAVMMSQIRTQSG